MYISATTTFCKELFEEVSPSCSPWATLVNHRLFRRRLTGPGGIDTECHLELGFPWRSGCLMAYCFPRHRSSYDISLSTWLFAGSPSFLTPRCRWFLLRLRRTQQSGASGSFSVKIGSDWAYRKTVNFCHNYKGNWREKYIWMRTSLWGIF